MQTLHWLDGYHQLIYDFESVCSFLLVSMQISMNVRMGECVRQVSAITLWALSCVLLVQMGLKGEMANVLVRSPFLVCLYTMVCVQHSYFLTNEGAFINVSHRSVFLQIYCVRDLLCADINECLDEKVCAHGQCFNREGYFVCSCDEGFSLTPDGKACIGTLCPQFSSF